MLKESPKLAPLRPVAGIRPQLSDAELGDLGGAAQALLEFTSEPRWVRYLKASMGHLFPVYTCNGKANQRWSLA